MSNRPELEKAKQPMTVRPWIQHQLAVVHYIDFVYLNSIRWQKFYPSLP